MNRISLHDPKYQLLNKDFYLRSSIEVASDLIGCLIVSEKDGLRTIGRITETEAYPGDDPASHVFGKSKTPRTTIQYEEGGLLYVYLIMGVHYMTSIVVSQLENPDVVFVRSIEPLEGLEIMKSRRDYSGKDLKRLASGPGKLSKALGITKSDNGISITSNNGMIHIYQDLSYKSKIKTGYRINLGLSHVSKEEAQLAITREWRFFESESNFLSV